MGVPRTSPRHLAYVFERFPTATQTFCIREVLEMERLGVRPLVFSIRDTSDEEVRNWPTDLRERVVTLPQGPALVDAVKALKAEGALPQSVILVLRNWGERPDKRRVYEAAWIGHHLARHAPEIRHAHCHFAGVAARTLWWLRRFHRHHYSITGHANDLFCDPGEVHPRHPQLLAEAAVIPTVSEFTADWIRTHIPGAASRVERAYNGLDLSPFKGRGKGIDSSPPLIASVGRLIEKKGFADLVAACAQLRDQGVELRCRIVGEGPLEMDLEKQIADLGVGDLVELAGALPIREITRLLEDEATLFALPCVVEADGGMDNLPTVIMEAMAAGLPVVSTRLAGVPEMVVEGETGHLVEPGDVAALVTAMKSYLFDREKARRAGTAGRRLCEERFAAPVTARRLLQHLVSRGAVRVDRAIALHLSFGERLRNRLRQVADQLRPRTKVRDKGFDLDRFMGS